MDDVEASIEYHESNLARLIQERDTAEERVAEGASVADSYYARMDAAIAATEHTIENWRTTGRGYA